MADPLWILSLKLQGATPKNFTRLNFILQYEDAASPFNLTQAQAAANDIIDQLDAASDAVIADKRLSYVMGASPSLAAAGVDVFDEALVLVHTGTAGNMPKLAALRIPAPVAVFESDGETLDIRNNEVENYVTAIANNAFVSDGERINLALGVNGVDSGHKRQKAKSYA